MSRYLKAVLIDLSGTLHIENELIPGSVEALNKYFLFFYAYIRYNKLNLRNIQIKLDLD